MAEIWGINDPVVDDEEDEIWGINDPVVEDEEDQEEAWGINDPVVEGGETPAMETVKPATDIVKQYGEVSERYNQKGKALTQASERFQQLATQPERTPEEEAELAASWKATVRGQADISQEAVELKRLQPEYDKYFADQKQARIDYIEDRRGSGVFGDEAANALYEIDARAEEEYAQARTIEDTDKRKEAMAAIQAKYQAEEKDLTNQYVGRFKENETKINNGAEAIGQAFASGQSVDQFLLESNANTPEYDELRDSLLNQDDPEQGKLFRESRAMVDLADGTQKVGIVNNEIRVSPLHVWDAESIKSEINALDISDAKKRKTIATIPQMQQEAVKVELPFLQKISEFNSFVKDNNLENVSPQRQISEWKNRNENWLDYVGKTPAQVGIGLKTGTLGLLEAGQAIVGATALTMGAQNFADPFLDAATKTSDDIQNLTRISKEIGGPTFAAELAAVVPQIVAQIGTGGAVGFGGAKLGLKPKVVSNIGFGSSVGTAFAQSYGGVLSSAFQTLEKEKIDGGMDPAQARAEAVKEAQLPAALSGLSTAVLTTIGGKRGAESVFREGVDGIKAKLNTAAFRAELPKLVPDIVKGMRNEGYEEFADQLAQGIIEQFTFNPELATSDIINNAFKALAIGGITGGTVEGLKYGFDYMKAPKAMARREESMASIRQSIADVEREISDTSASSPIGAEFQREYDATLPSDEAAALGGVAVDRTRMSALQSERQQISELLEDDTISRVARNQLEGKLAAADISYYNEVLAPMRRNVVNEQMVDQLDGMVVSQKTKDGLTAMAKIANGLGAETLTGRERVAVGITSVGGGRFLPSIKNPMVEVNEAGQATVTEAGRLMAENVGMVPLVRMIGLSETTRAKQAEMERVVAEAEARKAQQDAKDTAESEEAKRYGPEAAEALKQQVATQPPAPEKESNARLAQLLKEQEEAARLGEEAVTRAVETRFIESFRSTMSEAIIPTAERAATIDINNFRDVINSIAQEIDKGTFNIELIEQGEFKNILPESAFTTVVEAFKENPQRALNALRAFGDEVENAVKEFGGGAAGEPPENLEPLLRVVRTEQTPEDVTALTEAGLVEVYKDQPILTQAGIDALPEAERPRLNPEARKIQIDTGANEVVAEAISKGLRIGVDQVGPNVTMPQGWTLDGDIYVPPAPPTEPPIEPEARPVVDAATLNPRGKQANKILTNAGVDPETAAFVAQQYQDEAGEMGAEEWRAFILDKFEENGGVIPAQMRYSEDQKYYEMAFGVGPEEAATMVENAKIYNQQAAQEELEQNKKWRRKDETKVTQAQQGVGVVAPAEGVTVPARGEAPRPAIEGGGVPVAPAAPEVGAITEEQANNVIKEAQEARSKKQPRDVPIKDRVYGSLAPKETIGKTVREALLFASRLNLSKIAAANPNEIMMQDVAAILAQLDMPLLDTEMVVSLASQGYKGRAARITKSDGTSVIGMPSTIRQSVEILAHEAGHTLTGDQIKKYLPRKKIGRGKAYLDAINKVIADPATPEAVSRLFSLYVSTIEQLGVTEQYFGAKGIAGTPKADTSKAMARKLQAKGELRKDLNGSMLYGLANMEEFVSQTFSSKDFRNLLKGLKDPTNPQRTLWQAFVDAVQVILQLPKGSMAAAVIEASIDVGMTVAPERVKASGKAGVTPAPAPEPEPRAITPQQDADYLAAVERGDMEAAQRMVDEFANRIPDGGKILERNILNGKIKPVLFDVILTDNKETINFVPFDGSLKDSVSSFPLEWINYGEDTAPTTTTLNGTMSIGPREADYIRNAVAPFLDYPNQSAVIRDSQGIIIPLSQRFQQGEADMAPEPEGAPFYSQLERVVGEKMPNVSSPQQIKAIVDPSKGSGIKPEEIKWSGINDAIDRIASENNGKVPKDQLLRYIQDEGTMQFEEVVFGVAEAQEELTTEQVERLQYLERENAKAPLGAIDDRLGDGAFEELMTLENIRDKSSTQELRQSQQDFERRAQQAQRAGQRELAETLWERSNHMENRIEVLELRGGGIKRPSRFNEPKLVLPNGKNYREVVLATPRIISRDKARAEELEKKFANATISNEELQDLYFLRENADLSEKRVYRSSHFPDVDNYVAHYRATDRKDARGQEGMFLEEIQSDRHQSGRKYGYDGDFSPNEIINILSSTELSDIIREAQPELDIELDTMLQGQMQSIVRGYIQPENFGTNQYRVADEYIKRIARRESMEAVPDAPFRKDWGLQLFKRALVDAVSKGKQWIGWTVGETQNERYDLSRQINMASAIANADGTFNLVIEGKDGQEIAPYARSGKKVTEKELEDTVGKDVAAKLIEGANARRGAPWPQGVKENPAFFALRGLDLKIGGKGMKGFYDEMLPKEIGKYVKKWGATVEKDLLPITISPTDGSGLYTVRDADGNVVSRNITTVQEALRIAERNNGDYELEGVASVEYWKVNITPEMEESVTDVGQPLFAPEEEFEVIPEQVEDQIEGTPEAATIKVMGQAFQMANEQSAAMGTPQGTLPLETITSAWMNSGRDVETLENAIIRYTNLEPEAAATLAEAIGKQVKIQRGIMEISDAASRRKAEKEEEPEVKPYSFAERIREELPPELQNKVNLAYEVLRNEVSVEEANRVMSGLTLDEAIKATTTMDNGVSMPVRSMMAQIVLRKIMDRRKSTKGKKGKEGDYEAAVEAHVEFHNFINDYFKELGQGVQAIARFSDLGADGVLLKIRRDIDKAISKHIKNRKGQIDKIKRDVEEADSAAFDAAIKSNKANIDKTANKAGEQEAKKLTIEEQAQKLAIRAAKKVTGEEVRRRQPDPLSDLVNNHLRRYNANFIAEATAMGVSPVTAQAIEDSAIKLRDSRQATKSERERFKEMQEERMKVKKELARENKYIYGPRPTIWENYQDMFSERLARRLMRDPKKKVPPSLLLFTDRLTENLLGFVPEAERQATTQRSFQAMVEDALNNKEKYQEAFNRALEDISFKVMELEVREAAGEKISSATYKKAVAAQEFLERLEPIIQQFPVSDKLIMRFVNQKMKAMGESLVGRYNDWYRSSKKTRIEIEKALAEKLVADMNVSNADAINLSRAIIKDFRAKAEERREKALARFKKPKEKTKRLAQSPLKKFFELVNIGALTDQEAYEVMAHRFELPTWDPEFAKQIQEMALILEDMPEGMERRRLTRNMMAEIARRKGFSLSDLGSGFFYSNMLSSVETFLINLQDTLIGNFVNGLASSVAEKDFTRMNGLISGYRKGWREAVQVFRTGLRINMPRLEEKTPLTVELINYGRKGGVALESTEGMNAIAKTILESPPAKVLNWWRYVTRIMEATDALNYAASSEGQRYAEAAKMARDEGLEGKAKQKRINQILNLGDDVYQAALKQAEQEGYTGTDAKFRAMEIQDNEIDAEIREKSFNRALTDVYRNMPTGLAGATAAQFNNYVMRIANPWFRNAFKLFTAPFVITPTNLFNRWLDYSPYGYKRLFYGSGNLLDKDTPYYVAPPKVGSAEFYTQALKASSSVMVMGLAAGLIKAGLLVLRGMGPSDEEERKQWLADGNRPHTFSFMGGPQISYQFTPWALVLSWMANYQNWEQYNAKEDASGAERAIVAMKFSVGVVMDLPFFAGPAEFMEAMQKTKGDPVATLGKYVEGKMGMVYPNLVRQIDRFFDPTLYDSQGIKGVIIDQMPFARRLGTQRVNLFGDPIGEDKPVMDRVVGRLVSFPPKPSRESRILAKYDIYPYMPSPKEAKALVDGEQAQMTEEQYNKFVQIVGKDVKKRINDLFDPEGEITEKEKERGKKRISQIFERARARAVREVSTY